MPFGASVTSFLANLIPTDPLAPQVVGDFAKTYPTENVEGGKGFAVSSFATGLIPTDPLHPTDVGAQLSNYIHLLGPDVEADSWDLLG